MTQPDVHHPHGTMRLDQVKRSVRACRAELDAIREQMLGRVGDAQMSEAGEAALQEIAIAHLHLARAVKALEFAGNAIEHGVAYAERAATVGSALAYTPGGYLIQCRLAAGLSLDDVAAQIATTPPIAERERRAWLETIEADAAPLSPGVVTSLHEVFAFDPAMLGYLIENFARTHSAKREAKPALSLVPTGAGA